MRDIIVVGVVTYTLSTILDSLSIQGKTGAYIKVAGYSYVAIKIFALAQNWLVTISSKLSSIGAWFERVFSFFN